MNRAQIAKSTEWISRLAPLYSVIFLSSSVTLMLWIFYFETWITILCYSWIRSKWIKAKIAQQKIDHPNQTPKKEVDGCGSCMIFSTFVSAHVLFLLALVGEHDQALTAFIDECFKPNSPIVDQFKLTLLSIVVIQIANFYEQWKIKDQREFFLNEMTNRIGLRLAVGQFITIFGGWLVMIFELTRFPYILPCLAGLAILTQYIFDQIAKKWARGKSYVEHF